MIHPETSVLDAKAGIVQYVASDETLDADNEVIRAKGARFDRFSKNAPFLNSHRYGSIEDQLGSVIEFKVEGDRVVEAVKWAIDVPENRLAQFGFKMAEAGYLKAVSMGFEPEAIVTPADRVGYQAELRTLNFQHPTLNGKAMRPDKIFTRWQQLELSACVIPVNPNALAIKALAKARMDGLLTDADLDMIEAEEQRIFQEENATVRAAVKAAGAARTRQRRKGFVERLERVLKRI
jgi:hypothetical protein